MSLSSAKLIVGLCLVLLQSALPVCAQGVNVRATVKIRPANDKKPLKDQSNIVMWLRPLNAHPQPSPSTRRYTITQKNKSFSPHVLAVPVGTSVEFPNKDPFFHNVFSLFQGKRFDLGLYEAGSSRTVLFDKPGVSFVFCNIHPNMSAYVLALETPYFGVSDKQGNLIISGVPAGDYQLHVWYERAESPALDRLSRTIAVGHSEFGLGTIEVEESANFQPEHADKHGKNYDPEISPY